MSGKAFPVYTSFFPADGRQIEGGFARGVQAENMGDHFRRLDLFRLHQRHRGAHIVSITAGGADVVGKGVVHVVEVDRGAELLILGPAKKFRQPSGASNEEAG